MHLHHIAISLFTLLIIHLPLGEGGPARSIALAAQRSPKIPISIRAPFRNSETMVARGYGKRGGASSRAIFNFVDSDKDKNGLTEYALPRGYGKRLILSHPGNAEYPNYASKTMDFLDETMNSNNADGVNEPNDQISNESNPGDYSVPIEWVVKELAENPGLLKGILYRFVDTNKDGLLSSQELLMGSSSDNNHNSY